MLSFLPRITLTETEMSIVANCVGNPSVKKYLTSLAITITDDLLSNGEPQEGESAESFLRRQQNERGRLEVLESLLSIVSVASAV